ncbi:MAG: hypothetical protein JW958_00825 [Candidatus Eisenbacteria bacterium]|nr:hypothetical protein [Candidatus Eisenbacteria bacterium]
MFGDTHKLKTEQIIRNRLWRHSIAIGDEAGVRSNAGALVTALVQGLPERQSVLLHSYMVLPEDAIDREFFGEIENAESIRRPLMGGVFGLGEGKEWRSEPMAFSLSGSGLIGSFADRFWGGDQMAIFLSSLEPLEFFDACHDFPVFRREGGQMVYAPYWYPASFEKYLLQSASRVTDRIFDRIGYYIVESEGGRSVRVYCRGVDRSI